MNNRVYLLVIFFVLTTFIVTAQDNNTNRSSRAVALMNQARSKDRVQKIELLRSFEDGSVVLDSESIHALGLLAGMGTVQRDYTSANIDYADIRASALTLLGKSGLDEAKQMVLRAVDFESHPTALIAGFEAIANLGSSEGMLAIRVLNEAMLRNMARSRSSSVADEYLKAINVLANKNDPDMQTIEVLTQLSQGYGFSQTIRKDANVLLKSFWI